MKAIVHREYGSPEVLRYEDIATPVIGETDVLIRVHAASLNAMDWHITRGVPFLARLMVGLRKPKRIGLGVDVAGTVEVVGSRVSELAPGDEVFGSCRGSFAEYSSAPESAVVRKPANVTFEHAACAAVAGLTALEALRRAQVGPGQRVLINGASGGVGTFTVQIAKSLGTKVTGVCRTGNVAMVRSIGADHVIDYTRSDFTRGTERYDALIDIAGTHSLSAYRRMLKADGRLVIVGGSAGGGIRLMGRVIGALVLSPFVRQKLTLCMTRRNREDLDYLSELLASGKIRPVIDRNYRLSEAREALAYLGEGHVRGKVVLTTGVGIALPP
jgi:NADPH:quinone reductase-like Zn-dependent oxidoreductase